VQSISFSAYRDAEVVLRNPDLAQSLYDDGAVIMEDVLLTLHGEAHKTRLKQEMRVFRRDFFRYYETEVFPRTLSETLAPFDEAGGADLEELGYRVTMNLTADFAGIDRPHRTSEETGLLLRLVKTFSEGATLVHSTRDKEEVRAEVRQALAEFEDNFLVHSIARREDLLKHLANGEISEDDLPRDILTVLLSTEEALQLPSDVLTREIAFYLQAGAHSTANATIHSFHELATWGDAHPEDAERMRTDNLFLQRCVHEALRLHPASPVSWRRPVCPVSLPGDKNAGADDQVEVDLWTANRDPSIFGDDAAVFDPHRKIPSGIAPYGLTFGSGFHSCLGRDLDGGAVPQAHIDPATHRMGIVPLFVQALIGRNARRDPDDPPQPAHHTKRPNWGRYPVIFGSNK
jgi:cytochrome P450